MISQTHTFFFFTARKFSTLLLAMFASTFLGCTSLKTWFRQADSTLPLEATHSGSGKVASIRAFETSDRLYVAGSAIRNRLGRSGHVDIQLIGPDGSLIVEKRDAIHSVHSAPGGGRRYDDTYVASFPLGDARKAAKIRVVYHPGNHS